MPLLVQPNCHLLLLRRPRPHLLPRHLKTEALKREPISISDHAIPAGLKGLTQHRSQILRMQSMPVRYLLRRTRHAMFPLRPVFVLLGNRQSCANGVQRPATRCSLRSANPGHRIAVCRDIPPAALCSPDTPTALPLLQGSTPTVAVRASTPYRLPLDQLPAASALPLIHFNQPSPSRPC